MLGVRESKGCEWRDVAIVDFFADLDSTMHKPWKQVHTATWHAAAHRHSALRASQHGVRSMLRLRARAHVQLLRADRDVSVGRDFPELECKLKTLSPRIPFPHKSWGGPDGEGPGGWVPM